MIPTDRYDIENTTSVTLGDTSEIEVRLKELDDVLCASSSLEQSS
jgi:hypothetical protein